MAGVLRLYPQPALEMALEGLYLTHDLRNRAAAGQAFVYANFITSLDGRIAVARADGSLTVPQSIANDRDWRLFQELAVQADLLISSGRYLREWVQGKAQEILRTDDPRFADLRAWRVEQGLNPLPDIAILSARLDFPIPDILAQGGRRAVVVTHEGADPTRIREIEGRGVPVLAAGKGDIDGKAMLAGLEGMGYRSVYSAAGPKVLHLLLSSGVLNRLYLTFAHRLLGGEPYSSLLEGPLLSPPAGLRLASQYYDADGPGGFGQVFGVYDVEH